MKVLLVVICKLENNYIKEYVDYYKNIGFTNIVIGDNNDISGETFDEVIKEEIESGFVIIKNYRGLIKQQEKFYNDMYQEYYSKYDWIAFFDADEFLYFTKHKNIIGFLSDNIYINFDTIRLNWLCYDDNDLVCVKDGNYSINRFTRPLSNNVSVFKGVYVHQNSKTIVRCNTKDKYITNHGDIKSIKCCNDCGETIKNWYFTEKISHKIAYLKHYNTKTIDEWMVKIKRGYPDSNYNNKRMLSIDRFFLYNKKTKEKIDFLKKTGMEYID